MAFHHGKQVEASAWHCQYCCPLKAEWESPCWPWHLVQTFPSWRYKLLITASSKTIHSRQCWRLEQGVLTVFCYFIENLDTVEWRSHVHFLLCPSETRYEVRTLLKFVDSSMGNSKLFDWAWLTITAAKFPGELMDLLADSGERYRNFMLVSLQSRF